MNRSVLDYTISFIDSEYKVLPLVRTVSFFPKQAHCKEYSGQQHDEEICGDM